MNIPCWPTRLVRRRKLFVQAQQVPARLQGLLPPQPEEVPLRVLFTRSRSGDLVNISRRTLPNGGTDTHLARILNPEGFLLLLT
jgi:hypothetical protein